MKRLLEWKQRMLQSPLTRKTTPATLSLARSLNQTKSLTQTQGFNDRYTVISGQTFPKTSMKQLNHHTVYNSYSSDDEGNFISKSLSIFYSINKVTDLESCIIFFNSLIKNLGHFIC